MFDFKTFKFGAGAHPSRDKGMCVMEAVAYVAGEPHSDHPACACPIISAFLRSWNDGLSTDKDRQRLLGGFVFRLVATKASAEIELKRSMMAFRWLVNVLTPSLLEMTPSLVDHAKTLRKIKISKKLSAAYSAALSAAESVALSAARSAAYSAAESAARSAAYSAADSAALSAAYSAAESAARSAAYSAADSAALSAARSAAYSAAESAARSAAYSAADSAALSAARSAAYSAARSAAYSAAYSALAPTIKKLQRSAQRLLIRMIKLTEPQEAKMSKVEVSAR